MFLVHLVIMHYYVAGDSCDDADEEEGDESSEGDEDEESTWNLSLPNINEQVRHLCVFTGCLSIHAG